MSESPASSSRSEPSSTRPGRPAAQGALRRHLQDLFPDLDPDVVSDVLGLTGNDISGSTRTDEEVEK